MTFPILTSEDVIAGRWQVLRRIDSGGAAAVYAVKELGGERMLALKVVHRRDKGNAKRLKAEYETLSCLDHPNLIHVYEWGQDEEKCYYLMELIDGGPLREVIQAGLLTFAQSLDLYRQVLHAVAHLHKNEVIHRDIKPGNIVVDNNLRATLIDLGACRSPLRGEITLETDCTGTPICMSPEQAAICAGIKDPAVRKFADSKQADIYQLGVLLYHLLSGQWPHGRPGKSPAELRDFYRRRASERPDAAEFANEELGRLAMAMLLPAYQGRPGSLSGVIATFEAAFADMRDDSQVLSPLCNDETARLAKVAEAELKKANEARAKAGDEAEQEELAPDELSDTYTAAERLRTKLWGIGFLSAAGASGGLVVLLGAALIFGLGRGPDSVAVTSAPAVQPRVESVEMPRDQADGVIVWEADPAAAIFGSSALEQVARFVLWVKLITGVLPGQKTYPCNAARNEIPYKGGCWIVFVVATGTKDEIAEGCRTSTLYEPEPGWCVKARGLAYGPIPATSGVKPPTPVYGPDSPGIVKDGNGYKVIGGSGK